MLPLREFRVAGAGFPSLVNYFSLVTEEILLLKDGSYMACFMYYGQDMDSAMGEERDVLCARVNHVLSKLGTGWMINVDAVRFPASPYPLGTHYPDATTQLIEIERHRHYHETGKHFETLYVLSLTYKPSLSERHSKWNRFFVVKTQIQDSLDTQLEEALHHFDTQRQNIEKDLSAYLHIKPLAGSALLSFLHQTITGRQQKVNIPDVPHYLNYLLGAYDFIGGTEPSIDGQAIRVISIAGFPQESFHGMFDILQHLACHFRFSTRFITMDGRDAEKQLTALRTKLHLRQVSVLSAITQSFTKEMVGFVNEEAVSKTHDANDALNEAREGYVKYGYYTGCVVLIGETELVTQEAKQIRHILENKGFVARIETINAVEAYLGSLPGHAYPNLRKPILHTLNLAHMLPLTTIWAGHPYNPNPLYPEASPAFIYAATSGSTPFRLNLHVSDVGHSLILGPTGAGKSTLLAMLVAQFFKYPKAQVFAFDKGMSLYALCAAAGGDHYGVMMEDCHLGFCPLKTIDEVSDRLWAAGWLEELLILQGVTMTPARRNAINKALEALVGSKHRTLTEFYTTIQDNHLKEALEPFILVRQGIMADLLDAEQDGLSQSCFQVFEMEQLMAKDKRYSVPVLTYLFRMIEKRLDGRPSLIVLDEAWSMLGHELFADKIRQWLKTLRKANAAVVFATQSLSDILNSPIRDVIIESCPTKIFLPNAQATTHYSKGFYESLGLNAQQIELIANARPKRDYYYTSSEGQRLIELDLGQAALAFTGVSSPEAIAKIKTLQQEYQRQWPAMWLGIYKPEMVQLWQELDEEKQHQSMTDKKEKL